MSTRLPKMYNDEGAALPWDHLWEYVLNEKDEFEDEETIDDSLDDDQDSYSRSSIHPRYPKPAEESRDEESEANRPPRNEIKVVSLRKRKNNFFRRKKEKYNMLVQPDSIDERSIGMKETSSFPSFLAENFKKEQAGKEVYSAQPSLTELPKPKGWFEREPSVLLETASNLSFTDFVTGRVSTGNQGDKESFFPVGLPPKVAEPPIEKKVSFFGVGASPVSDEQPTTNFLGAGSRSKIEEKRAKAHVSPKSILSKKSTTTNQRQLTSQQQSTIPIKKGFLGGTGRGKQAKKLVAGGAILGAAMTAAGKAVSNKKVGTSTSRSLGFGKTKQAVSDNAVLSPSTSNDSKREGPLGHRLICRKSTGSMEELAADSAERNQVSSKVSDVPVTSNFMWAASAEEKSEREVAPNASSEKKNRAVGLVPPFVRRDRPRESSDEMRESNEETSRDVPANASGSFFQMDSFLGAWDGDESISEDSSYHSTSGQSASGVSMSGQSATDHSSGGNSYSGPSDGEQSRGFDTTDDETTDVEDATNESLKAVVCPGSRDDATEQMRAMSASPDMGVASSGSAGLVLTSMMHLPGLMAQVSSRDTAATDERTTASMESEDCADEIGRGEVLSWQASDVSSLPVLAMDHDTIAHAKNSRGLRKQRMCCSIKNLSGAQLEATRRTGLPVHELSPEEVAQMFPKLRTVPDNDEAQIVKNISVFEDYLPVVFQSSIPKAGKPQSVYEYDYESGQHMFAQYSFYGPNPENVLRVKTGPNPEPLDQGTRTALVQVEVSMNVTNRRKAEHR